MTRKKRKDVNDKREKHIEFHDLSNTFNIVRPHSKQPVAFIKYATNTAHLIGTKPSKTDKNLTRISCLYSPHSTRYPGAVYLKSMQSS